jgi:hypothetical protein
MGITGGLACHLFAYLIGLGASSIVSIIKSHNKSIKYIEFNLFTDDFIRLNKIALLALLLIFAN